MEIDLALLADAATVDAAGKLNILGVFDRISTGGFPAQHPHISLVFRIGASINEGGDHNVEIVLHDPDGREVVPPLSGQIKIGPGPAQVGGRVRVPQVVNLERLVFPREGRYSFDISIDGKHQVSVPLFLHDASPKGPMAQA
jgi:hypothetical protein